MSRFEWAECEYCGLSIEECSCDGYEEEDEGTGDYCIYTDE